MEIREIGAYARALYNAHGDRAEVEAAQKMRWCEEVGKPDEAADWQAIRSAIHELRGPNQG